MVYEGYLMRFLEVIRGALIAAPKRLLPVIYMPLFDPRSNEECDIRYGTHEQNSYQLLQDMHMKP